MAGISLLAVTCGDTKVQVSQPPPATGGTYQMAGAAGSGAAGGAGGSSAAPGGMGALGGAALGGALGGAATGGAAGGRSGGGGFAGASNAGGNGGNLGGAPVAGPCDIYGDAGQPCVAAYSTVRRLARTYAGPLYQIRIGSSAENTGTGGTTQDVGQTSDGFADGARVDALCVGTVCTVSLLYDQSGHANDLPVAKAGIPFGGPTAALDDFETLATQDARVIRGHKVYPLAMGPRQGYRLPRRGDGVPRGAEAQGIYLLADGTQAGTGCCWEFGNIAPDAFRFATPTALFYGSGLTAGGAGEGPWFMADFGGIFVIPGEAPGIDPVPNSANPSLKVKFALGLLKTDSTRWGLRMADVATASVVTTAAAGAVPKKLANDGAVGLGINADNSNASSGTFYEGAIVAGFPSDETENAVLLNVKTAGYLE